MNPKYKAGDVVKFETTRDDGVRMIETGTIEKVDSLTNPVPYYTIVQEVPYCKSRIVHYVVETKIKHLIVNPSDIIESGNILVFGTCLVLKDEDVVPCDYYIIRYNGKLYYLEMIGNECHYQMELNPVDI